MISVDGGFCALDVATPFAECFNKGIEFLFPGGIPENSVRVLAGEKADGVEIGLW
jgi:hypothetical protein